MRYYCNPLNLPYKYQMQVPVDHANPDVVPGQLQVYREAADPSLILFKDTYFLFPSMTAGFYTSDNLLDWQFYALGDEIPVYDYAPDVTAVGDYLYFCASRRGDTCSFYRTKDPRSEPFEEIKGTFEFFDPNLFEDDDGRLYFYWGCSNVTPIYGVELEKETMKPKTEPLIMFDSNHEIYGYERIGNDHINPKSQEAVNAQIEALMSQLMMAAKEDRAQYGFGDGDEKSVRQIVSRMYGDSPFIEGAWMTKHHGKYYLQYAVPGTEFNIYGNGVYVSDRPLGPFFAAKNNPFSYKPGGFMNGAGHGSTLKDKDGKWYHTATMSISCNATMERRIGLWNAGFDEEGDMFCDQRYGDWPTRIDAEAFEKPDWMLLSYGKHVKASSGSCKEAATDEDAKTWWKAAKEDSRPWVEVDLGSAKEIHAVQINFADDEIQAQMPKKEDMHVTYETRYIDRVHQNTRWLLEGSEDGTVYITLADKSQAETDLPHDFLVYEEGIRARYLRLSIMEVPYHQPPCISGIRVFGFGDGAFPEKTKGITVEQNGPLDITVSWSEDRAVGHNILWGYAPDKLYHSYMVFGKNSQNIGALIKGQKIYLRIDAFNEVGITEGQTELLQS